MIETFESFFKWFSTNRTGHALHVLDCCHVAGKLGDDRLGARCRGPRVEAARQTAAPHPQPLLKCLPCAPSEPDISALLQKYPAGTCQLLRDVVR